MTHHVPEIKNDNLSTAGRVSVIPNKTTKATSISADFNSQNFFNNFSIGPIQ